MEWIANHTADIVVLLVLLAVMALALRSVIRSGALDCSTCNGDCSGCGGTCANPKLRLSKEQEAELDALTAHYANEEASR